MLGLFSKLNKKIVGQDRSLTRNFRINFKIQIRIARQQASQSEAFYWLEPAEQEKLIQQNVLRNLYTEDRQSLYSLDMSEFSEKISASRLIGASPGYVGYEEGGESNRKSKKKSLQR
jgi:ATP-dependent Clp protease ATP-binding subunit ClpA